ncbi:MAG: DUF4233 domain-containing protein [Bowdeniella nasicola]|nr:DUF4233 domain-containing protein [Bowdeniella nasicola]
MSASIPERPDDPTVPPRDPGATEPAAAPVPEPRSARRLFCLVLLILEALVALFLALVLNGLNLVESGLAWTIGGGVAALAIVAAGSLRTRVGLILGSLVQVVLLASGWWIGDMIVLGVIFTALWITSIVLGGRIDTERWERYHAELALRDTGH